MIDVVLLDYVKKHSRIDFDWDDDLLELYIGAAIETLKAAGCPERRDSSLYMLAVVRLTGHYYEHPEEVGANQSIPMGLNWMIEHLRLHD